MTRLRCALCTLIFVGTACAKTPAPQTPTKPHDPIAAAQVVGLDNGRITGPGLLVGGQPTDEQLATAKEVGFDVVINLRSPTEPGVKEERAKVEALGMRYVSIPVNGAAGLTKENAERLGGALESINGSQALLHCASSNRAGALLGLKLFAVDDAPANDAVDYAKRAGMTTLEPALRKAIASLCEERDQRCEGFDR